MPDGDHGMHIAARVEISHQLHPARASSRHQIIKNAIDHFLMGDGLIAPAIYVELEGLELKHFGPRLVSELQPGEVGITREGALAGEFRQADGHVIGSTLTRILKTDQLCFFDGALAIGGSLRAAFGRRTRGWGCQWNGMSTSSRIGNECYVISTGGCLK